MSFRIIKYLVPLFSLSFISCTRSQDDSSKITFSVPTKNEIMRKSTVQKKVKNKLVSQSVEIPGYADLSHVIINIGGPGIASTILCHYDLEHEAMSGPCNFSAFPNISLEIPSGSDRLIQVALAFSDSSTGSMSFEYGDTIKTLNPGTEVVTLTMADIGVGGEEGHIKGRYLTSADDGPTGVLEVKIKPSESKPSLTLMRTEIFSGWFSAFSMSGLKFEYVVNNSLVLWNQGVDRDFFDNLEAQAKPVVVSDSNSGFETTGFFGDAAFTNGKTSLNSGSCANGTEYVSCLTDNSRFSGPFKKVSNNSGTLDITSGVASWALLPGAQNHITDFKILYHPTVDINNNAAFLKAFSPDRGLYNCSYLESYAGTQVIAASVPVSQSSYTLGVSMSTGTELLTICPRLAGVSYLSALTYPDLEGNGDSNSGPYLRIELGNGGGGMTPTLTLNQCYPAMLNLYISTGSYSADPYPAVGNITLANLSTPSSGTQWISFYSDSSCNNLVSGNLTINSGSSSYTGNVYAKGILVGNNLSLSPTITSSDPTEAIEYQPEHNDFNVSEPLLSISGPSTMIITSGAPPSNPQMCYAIRILRKNAEGYEISQGNPPLVINYNFGTDYTLYDDYPNCSTDTSGSTNGTVTIPSDTSYIDVVVKRTYNSLSSVNLDFTASGYQTGSLAVAGSNSSKIGSKFIISAVGTHEVGKCNIVKVSHVNNVGQEIPVTAMIEYKVDSHAQIKLTDDPSCLSELMGGKITFVEGEHTKYLYYFAYSAISHNIAINQGANNGVSSTIAVNLPTDPDVPYLTFNLPAIKSPILGSHDFPKSINLSVSPGTTVQCYQANQPYNYNDFSTVCPGFNSSNNVFTWTAADASQATMKGFRFTVIKGSYYQDYYFIPEKLYSRQEDPAIPFDVRPCDTVLTANGSTGINVISTNLANNVLCLGAGSFAGGAGAPLSIGANKYIIGATGTNGEPTTSITANASAAIFATGSSGNSPGATLANINLNPVGGGAANAFINMNTSSPGDVFRSFNNVYTITTAEHPYGILKNDNAADLESFYDKFVIDGTLAHTFGIKISSYTSRYDSTMIYNPLFSMLSGSSPYFSRGVGVYQSDSDIVIENASLDATNKDGSLVSIDQSGNASRVTTVEINNSNLVFSSATDNSSRFPFYFDLSSTAFITNSKIDSTLPQQIIKSYTSADAQFEIGLVNSKFISRNDIPVILLNTSFIQTINTESTHFIRTTNSGSGTSAIEAISNIAHILNTPAPLTSPRDTYFCGASAGTNWAFAVGGFTPDPASSLLISLALPTVTTSYDPATMSCY